MNSTKLIEIFTTDSIENWTIYVKQSTNKIKHQYTPHSYVSRSCSNSVFTSEENI